MSYVLGESPPVPFAKAQKGKKSRKQARSRPNKAPAVAMIWPTKLWPAPAPARIATRPEHAPTSHASTPTPQGSPTSAPPAVATAAPGYVTAAPAAEPCTCATRSSNWLWLALVVAALTLRR